jgi:hypothetical protein
MSDPVRLSDAGSEASPELRELLEGGRQDLPSRSEVGHLAARLAPVLGGAAVAAGTAAVVASGGAAGAGQAGVGLGVKLLVGVALAGVVGGGVVLLTSDETPRPHDPPAAAREPVVTPHAGPETPMSPELQSPSEPVPSARAKQPLLPNASEAQLLQRAQSALKDNPEGALALAREHRRRFPQGALAQEREVIMIEAMSRLGRIDEARKRSERFERNYPGSAHRRKVESAVE